MIEFAEAIGPDSDGAIDVTDLAQDSSDANETDAGSALVSDPVDTADRRSPVLSEQPAEPDVVAEDSYFSFDSLPPFPHLLRHPLRAGYWIFEVLFGIVSLFAMLALLAAIPVVNFLALGYLLEAEGRVARTGKLRYAMPLLPLAPKLGGIAFGTWIWCKLVQIVADAASDAELISPGSWVAIAWQIGLTLITVFTALHVVLAIARGGRLGLFFCDVVGFVQVIANSISRGGLLGQFFWLIPVIPVLVAIVAYSAPQLLLLPLLVTPPIQFVLNALWLVRQLMKGDYAAMAGTAVREFVAALRLRHHFWLGLRGFFGALAWLLIPTALFGALRDTSKPGQVFLTLLGALILAAVLTWIPFLQARFAAEHRLSAMFEFRKIRDLYRRAPIVFLLSITVMYALALPLYLFKLFETPQDMRWMLTPVFIVSIYPTRILIGWAYSWADRKQKNAWLIVRLLCGLLVWPLLSFYLLMLFFTPAVGAAGRAVLFQHHAVLLPWPF